MKHNQVRFFIIIFAIVLALAMPTVIVAATNPIAQTEPETLPDLAGQVAALAGVSALIAVIVNTLKYAKVVKDGDAKMWALGFNILALAGFYVLKVVSPDTPVEQVDGIAGSIARIAVMLLYLVSQMGISVGANFIFSGVPIVGYKHPAD